MPVENEENGGEVSDTLSDNENECDDRDVLMRDADDDKMAEHATSSDHNGEAKKKYDPKDPLRPRRKKARRACYACQRAHLTCGTHPPKQALLSLTCKLTRIVQEMKGRVSAASSAASQMPVRTASARKLNTFTMHQPRLSVLCLGPTTTPTPPRRGQTVIKPTLPPQIPPRSLVAVSRPL